MTTSVIALVSEKPVNNFLSDFARQQATQSGARLAWMGFKADSVVSAPQACAVETAYCTLGGMGAVDPMIYTDVNYDDSPNGKVHTCDESMRGKLQAKAEGIGLTLEQYLISFDRYYALHCLIKRNTGQTIFICVSAGTVMERMILCMDEKGVDLRPDRSFAEGSRALLVFDETPSAELLEVRYFGNLGLRTETLPVFECMECKKLNPDHS